MATIDVNELVLEDFADIWFSNTEDIRYRLLKGGRETGKSFNFIGIEPLLKLLDDDRRNIMMIRQNDKDNVQSTYIQLKYAANFLGIMHLFKFTKSPYKITRKATGQVILFGGMNDVQNITSTAVETGYWTDIYFEEASQLKSYEDFLTIDGSLRIPEGADNLWCQITFCMNAWDVGHWTYDAFFKDYLEDNQEELENNRYQFAVYPDFNIGFGFGLALHISSYKCNSHRNRLKDRSMEIMKEKMYDYYKVAGLGMWGALSDRTYEHWNDNLVITQEWRMNDKVYNTMAVGIDFGMSNGEGKIKYSEDNARRLGSANTMQLIGIATNWQDIISVDEYFDSNDGRDDTQRKTSVQIQKEMIQTLIFWRNKYKIPGILPCYVDCADSGGFIDGLAMEAQRQGEYNVRFIPSSKIPILSRVYFENIMMAYSSYKVSCNCKNLIREIKNARKAKDGRCREDFDDHAINAFEYAWIPLRKRLVRWRSFKDPLKSEGGELE
jgi:PBSX family phage terminase large subunit